MIVRPPKSISGKDAKKMIGYKSSAFSDYIAARVLFNSDCLIQACILANTCIEKEIKAYLLYHNKTSKSHDILNLFNQMAYIDPSVKDDFNKSFISVLTKLYRYRYPEDCNDGYNYVICRNKFLAELDYTYHMIEGKSAIMDSNSNPKEFEFYNAARHRNDSRLLNNNYILNNIKKSDFLNKTDLVNELRLYKNNRVFSIQYYISHNPDNEFDHQGVVITPVNVEGEDAIRLNAQYGHLVVAETGKA